MYLVLSENKIDDLSTKSKMVVPHHYDISKFSILADLPVDSDTRRLLVLRPSKQTNEYVTEVLGHFNYNVNLLTHIDLSDKDVTFRRVRASISSMIYFFFDTSSGLYSIALNKKHFIIYDDDDKPSSFRHVTGRNGMIARFTPDKTFPPFMIQSPIL